MDDEDALWVEHYQVPARAGYVAYVYAAGRSMEPEGEMDAILAFALKGAGSQSTMVSNPNTEESWQSTFSVPTRAAVFGHKLGLSRIPQTERATTIAVESLKSALSAALPEVSLPQDEILGLRIRLIEMALEEDSAEQNA